MSVQSSAVMSVRCIALLLYVSAIFCAPNDVRELCDGLFCEDDPGGEVCGVREEGEGLNLRLFDSQCDLLKFGCSVDNEKAYGIIHIEYCRQKLNITSPESQTKADNDIKTMPKRLCINYDCSYPDDAVVVCAIRKSGDGFKVRLFKDKCQLIKYNCENDYNFIMTDLFICNGMEFSEDVTANYAANKSLSSPVFVVDGSMFNFNKNVNETIENFFAATHVLNLPVENVQRNMNEGSRRMLVKIFGPQVVFKPWIKIPKNISEDYYHKPTLSSCFHTCPTKCPDTYAPVCGVPGIVAREPSLMFQNHCFMDVAQCKMHWEDKSPTAESSYTVKWPPNQAELQIDLILPYFFNKYE